MDEDPEFTWEAETQGPPPWLGLIVLAAIVMLVIGIGIVVLITIDILGDALNGR